MMGDTYARVSENATAKWRLARALLLALERRVSVATRDRLAAGVWIVVDGAFLQVSSSAAFSAAPRAPGSRTALYTRTHTQ